MPTYVLRCVNCGDQETVARMSEAAEKMPCPICQRERPQVFHAPQFQEDRLRMWTGPMGNGYSHALGEQMPSSRSERDRIAKAKGVEFCSKAELLADSAEARDAVAYHADVRAGAKPEPVKPVDQSLFRSTPEWAKPLMGG